MIKMLLIGHLGKDCTVNNHNGKNVINFNVAHTEKWNDAQGVKQERTTWVDCSWWSDKTTVAPYLLKGKQVYIEGTPEVRTFQRQDGTSGASLSLRVISLQLLGGATTAGGQTAAPVATANQQPAPAPAPAGGGDMIDDLPF